MSMKVLKVLKDGSAVVSTRGLRRIVDERGKVIVEFVRAAYAPKCVAHYNADFPNGESRAKAVKYAR